MKAQLLPEHHEFRRYSESFKTQVIKEYESSGRSMQYLQRKYGIRSVSTVFYWIRESGKEEKKAEGPYLSGKKKLPEMSNRSHDESVETQRLKKRILELERELQDARLLTEAYSLMIKKAEEELKIPIRKKYSTK